MDSLFFIDLEKGSAIPTLDVGAITRTDVVRYVAAANDFNPLYYDDDYARSLGKQGVIVPGLLVMSHIGRMMGGWIDGALLETFSLHQIRLVRPGDSLTCRGLVVELRQADLICRAEVEVWAENQRGETVAKGRVVLVVPYSKDKPIPKKVLENGMLMHSPCDKGKTRRKTSN